jgi:hypothetical protein
MNSYAKESSNKRTASSASSSAWGFLKNPTRKDVVGPGGKRRKGLDAPPKEFDYLLVMDFEWSEYCSRESFYTSCVHMNSNVALLTMQHYCFSRGNISSWMCRYVFDFNIALRTRTPARS